MPQLSFPAFYLTCQFFFIFVFLQTENPGPGNYVGHTTIEKQSTSFSKKGTGGFASKVIWKFGLISLYTCITNNSFILDHD